MRVVVQRVLHAQVAVNKQIVGETAAGLLLLAGITHADTVKHADWMARKIANLRLFPSLDGPSGFDRSVVDMNGGILLVSQFTLYGETRKGRRPDFVQAANPDHAAPLIAHFALALREAGINHLAQGVFGADMQVTLLNDGPMTLVINTPEPLP